MLYCILFIPLYPQNYSEQLFSCSTADVLSQYSVKLSVYICVTRVRQYNTQGLFRNYDVSLCIDKLKHRNCIPMKKCHIPTHPNHN